MGKLEHLPFEFETAETMLHLLGPGVIWCQMTIPNKTQPIWSHLKSNEVNRGESA